MRGKRGAGASTARKRPKRVKRRTGGLAAGLVAAEREGEDHVLNIATKMRDLDVYFPKARLSRGGYARNSPTACRARPPILKSPTDSVRMRRRTYQRYFDGKRLRLIAWKGPKGAWYWVSNTLSQQLSNAQMMDIARSLQRIGE